MEVEDFPKVDPDVDYTQILPIQQKRTIAFINHFIMNTVSFLNTFCHSCESRLMEFEYKLQKIEASLLILESQLSSISCPENVSEKQEITENVNPEQNLDLPDVVAEQNSVSEENPAEEVTSSSATAPRACEDSRFMRFFKMIQFGVPAPAVKLKMETEGIDSSILDKPNEVIPGYSLDKPKSSSSSDTS